MPYAIDIRDAAFDELHNIKPYHRNRIIDAIDRQLAFEPNIETRNRKQLAGLQPDFDHDPPVWELRVGLYRVYYDISEESKTVVVRAVREKPPHTTTEEVT
jgi:mRNA-degrading endonuclease RelE of RelBE toxin-antitoxin system